MLSRRLVLCSPLALLACGGDRRADDGPKVPSDLATLDTVLQRFEQVLVATRFPMHELRGGIPRDAVHAQVATLPFAFPEELYRLYRWHDGTIDNGQPLFRDLHFLPLARALAEMAPIAKHYGLRDVVPFATLEGAWYVVPARPWTATHREQIVSGRFERPVIEVYEGVQVVFDSVAHLVRTETARRERGPTSAAP